MFSSGHSQSLGFDIYPDASLRECIDKHMKISPDVYKVLNFFVQTVLYLCADNADIEENYVQKQTYKKPQNNKPKDKFTELRKWDVGYRYGAAVRKLFFQKGSTSVSGPHTGSHSRKRTHVRRGHWHHFWRGKRDGERTLALKWVSPVVVNAEYENVTTIHRAKLIQ